METSNIYSVTFNPETYLDMHVRIDSQSDTMTIAQSRDPSEPESTVIIASGINTDILSQLTYGLNANSTTDIFTTVCTIHTSSWQWVPFHSDRYASVFPSDIYCAAVTIQKDPASRISTARAPCVSSQGSTDIAGTSNLGIVQVQGNTLTNEEFRNSTAEDEQTYTYIYNIAQLESILS